VASGGCVATRPSWLEETGFSLATQAGRALPRGAARRSHHGFCSARRSSLAALAFIGLITAAACDTARDAGDRAPAARDLTQAPAPGTPAPDGSPPDASSPDGVAGGATADSIVVVDDMGRTVVLAQPAARVISLIPTHTEIVMLLAGAEVLLARTQWDIDPALSRLPSIGNALSPSIEWLAAQRPDLVIAWPDAQTRDVVQRLSDIGIPVYASRVESITEIRSMIGRLGVLLGRGQRADSLIVAIDAQLDSVRALVAGRPRRSVLYLLNVDPPMAAGPGTFVHELIELAGGENVFSDVRQLWPQVSLEEIVRRQPHVVIRPTTQAVAEPLADLVDRAGWRDLDAVRSRRVHGIDPYFYNRPGAGVGQAARGLAERIHAPGAQPSPAPRTQPGPAIQPAPRTQPGPAIQPAPPTPLRQAVQPAPATHPASRTQRPSRTQSVPR
jgi:iron complex transport system substrate-binding protein